MNANPTSFALRSLRVITPQGQVAALVIIKNGLIESVLPHDADIASDIPVEDLGNLILMPGLVDSHVHINEPGRTEWEGFDTATQAAAAGGITTLVDMPLNCIPVTTNSSALAEKLTAVKNKLWVDCGFWGGVIPESIDDLDALLAAGVLGVKSFLIDSGIEEFPNVTESDLRRAMPICAKYDVPYLIHAELDCEGSNSEQNAELVSSDQRASYQHFLTSRPDRWETDAIDLMIKLTKEAKQIGHDCKVHIVHLSSARALDSIQQAKNAGLGLTVETCPHYLTLFSEDIERLESNKTLYKCCPPIREQKNQQALWSALEQGLIDFIVSDHSPCTPELKLVQSGDIQNAWGGIAALQFGLALIWTAARDRGFEFAEISRLMSAAPADFIGLGQIKGRLAPGYHADLVVFDETSQFNIQAEMIRHKHKISPYVGRQVTGEVKRTYLRGELIYSDNQFVSDTPTGRPLLKSKASNE